MAEHEDLRKLNDFDKHKEPEERLVSCETAPGVEPQPVLPRDVFLNKFTYFLYFLVRSPAFWGSLVLLGIFLLYLTIIDFALLIPPTKLDFASLSSETTREFASFLSFSIMSIYSFFALMITAVIVMVKHDVSECFKLEQEMRFLIEIGDVKPGIDNSKWDIVASRMNNYLFEVNYFSNRYSFYDGQHCCKEFKKRYLLPRKDVFSATLLNDSIYGENGGFDYFKRQVSKDYYNSADE